MAKVKIAVVVDDDGQQVTEITTFIDTHIDSGDPVFNVPPRDALWYYRSGNDPVGSDMRKKMERQYGKPVMKLASKIWANLPIDT
jgi:hypothetical protein